MGEGAKRVTTGVRTALAFIMTPGLIGCSKCEPARGPDRNRAMTSIAARAVQMLSLRQDQSFSIMLEDWLADERHQLVLFIPVFLGLGIGAWFLLPTERSWIGAIAAGLAIAASGLLMDGLSRRCIMGAGFLFAAGLAIAWTHSGTVAAPVLERERFGISFSGEVVSVEPQPARDRVRLLIRPVNMLENSMTVRVSISGDVSEDIQPGAIISLRAGLTPPPGPSIPGGYHFARRAWFEGIGATGF
ncbi:MAG: DUF4131 domain-containing protein, partial [Pacificimonas sp.]